MIFSLSSLLRSILLLINALAILSEKRVLLPIGLSSKSRMSLDDMRSSKNPFLLLLYACCGNSAPQVRTTICSFLGSIRTLLRIPLIAVNSVAIAFAVIFG
mmetsp:Transcript_29609/g.45759  ORF Transcript_29609/g.45759 Transcript_29609/m.45759 type:complete len:101 (+) Transcript_29609:69-371(+)